MKTTRKPYCEATAPNEDNGAPETPPGPADAEGLSDKNIVTPGENLMVKTGEMRRTLLFIYIFKRTSGPEVRIRTVIILTIPATMEILRSTALMVWIVFVVFLDMATSHSLPGTSGVEEHLDQRTISNTDNSHNNSISHGNNSGDNNSVNCGNNSDSGCNNSVSRGNNSGVPFNIQHCINDFSFPHLSAVLPDDPEERYPWMRKARSKKLSQEMLDFLEQHPNWLPENPNKGRRNMKTIRKPYSEDHRYRLYSFALISVENYSVSRGNNSGDNKTNSRGYNSVSSGNNSCDNKTNSGANNSVSCGNNNNSGGNNVSLGNNSGAALPDDPEERYPWMRKARSKTALPDDPEERYPWMRKARSKKVSQEMLDLLEQLINWLPENPNKGRRSRMNIRKPFLEGSNNNSDSCGNNSDIGRNNSVSRGNNSGGNNSVSCGNNSSGNNTNVKNGVSHRKNSSGSNSVSRENDSGGTKPTAAATTASAVEIAAAAKTVSAVETTASSVERTAAATTPTAVTTTVSAVETTAVATIPTAATTV
ncbi:uncharacterized protein DDB_G0287625-like [Eleutherodactylus coqui]|uniref:uncharacterized protein DDB_G0287625-like n=1 Tax=Eleutherodactylus coqui TaxID=57060 RepID=UPI00346249B2